VSEAGYELRYSLEQFVDMLAARTSEGQVRVAAVRAKRAGTPAEVAYQAWKEARHPVPVQSGQEGGQP
jgi:hypothetical protein